MAGGGGGCVCFHPPNTSAVGPKPCKVFSKKPPLVFVTETHLLDRLKAYLEVSVSDTISSSLMTFEMYVKSGGL